MDSETEGRFRLAGRRRALRRLLGSAAWILSATSSLLHPILSLAAGRNVPAFDAKAIDEAVAAAGVADAIESDAIVLRAPDIAENSALVHVEIESRLPETSSIMLFAEKNPQPLVAQFDVLPGMDPFVAIRIKMAESAHLRVVVTAGGKHYFTRRETKVTLGGCAG